MIASTEVLQVDIVACQICIVSSIILTYVILNHQQLIKKHFRLKHLNAFRKLKSPPGCLSYFYTQYLVLHTQYLFLSHGKSSIYMKNAR